MNGKHTYAVAALWLVALLMLCLQASYAQDSCRTRVSLLTCSPGSELYSIFGHSALRVVDSATGTDIVYNYGTFDFSDPDFYSKFVRGKLLYTLSQQAFSYFQYDYFQEQRSIDEQVLRISCTEKEKLKAFLAENLRPENKDYRYDFLYDNCTTRLRDIIEKFRDPSMKNGEINLARGMTFRNGIHYYLDRGEMHWSKLGIDLLLGSTIDKPMTNREAMFLPEFLEAAVDGTTSTSTGSMVAQKTKPVDVMPAGSSAPLGGITPLALFTTISLVIIVISILPGRRLGKFLKGFDVVLFAVLGLLGCIFLFMWAGTDHKQTVWNYNLLWAWPTHLLAAFFIGSNRPNVGRYFFIYMLITGITLLCWAFLPQQLNIALIPLLIMIMFRCWKIYSSYAAKNSIPA